jgi:hypothetical protein
MHSQPTSYDEVAYPSLLFRQSQPDRLAVIARLHGLNPPPVETARMLLVGGGDGLDAIALAAAYPQAQFVNFDLAAQPIERGRRWSEAAGLTNIRHEVLDILDAADTLDGPFDYIVAHGVYAWVPDHVRTALMAMFGRLLSPLGVAFVSYNALPGGYSRMALRDMMLHEVGHIADPTARIAAAQDLLRRFSVQQPNDAPITRAMRIEAEVALTYADGLLYHDQLNGFYNPQSLTQVVDAARAQGLRYMGDARGSGADLGFLDPSKADMDEAAWLHALQALDYRNGRYFHASLLVRAEADISRVVRPEAAADMWISTRSTHDGADRFTLGKASLQVTDPRRADMLRRLIAARPGWLRVADLVEDPDLLGPLCSQAIQGFVDLHTVAPPFVPTAGETPVAGAVARMQAAAGEAKVAALDHALKPIDDEERRLLPLLDGTRDRAALAAAVPMPIDPILDRLAKKAMLSA